MIIGNVVGGLGNQMFQYACLRALGLDTAMPLAIVADTFVNYVGHNGLEIDRVFKLPIRQATRQELIELIGPWRTHPRMRRWLAHPTLSWLAGPNFIAEPSFSYWQGLKPAAQFGGYLHGYWQSARYFARHADIIRSDLAFKTDLCGVNRTLADRIGESASISVHVRRGDYVNNPKTLAVHGVCSLDYYLAALLRMTERYPGAQVYAFSDDPEWVQEWLLPRFPEMTVVAHNKGADSYIDMQLMSMCTHHIIANSSFSWWAAWLNPRLDKTVMAPKQWFAKNTDTADLLPAAWERI
jgi:hypothetical protein